VVSIKSLVDFEILIIPLLVACGIGNSSSQLPSARLAPCVNVLSQLLKNFNDILGADQGTRHAPANLSEDITTIIKSLDENNMYRINKGQVLDDDDEPIKDVIAVGLQNLVEGNKNPLSDYNEAFRNLQARRRRKPAIAGLAKEKTDATEATSNTSSIQVPQRHEDASESGASARMAMRMDNIDSEAGDVVDKDGFRVEPEPVMSSIFYQPGAGEAESTFATMGPDDVALDMDKEVGIRWIHNGG
jgi:hypothetical protein